jgi:catechol 2,3-dioxygenase-like lactoylglutathione lyase family enzyme
MRDGDMATRLWRPPGRVWPADDEQIVSGRWTKKSVDAAIGPQKKGTSMQLRLSRIILFTANMDRMVSFYRDVLGLRLKTDDKGWKTFDAAACEIALHGGGRKPGAHPPKLQFDVKDVAATRAALITRGAKMGKVSSKDGLDLCGGKDPDGNPFSLSNRS